MLRANSGGGRPKPLSPLAVLAAAVVLFLVAGLFLVGKKSPDQAPYLSFSADLDGTKASAEMIKGVADDVRQWKQPWTQLPDRVSGGVLAAIQPALGGIDPKERDSVLQWVERGNHLLVIQQRPDEWAGLSGDRLEQMPETADGAHSVKRSQIGATTAEALSDKPHTRYRLKGEQQSEQLLTDDFGTLAAKRDYGQGTITVMLTPEWLRNDTINRHGHFELVWPIVRELAAERTVWIDEYHHGITSKPGLLAVYPGWLLAVYAQLALALLGWLWIRGKRFGPVHTPREWIVRRGDETLLAVSGWFRKRRLNGHLLREQELYVRHLLQERYGVRAQASLSEWVETVRSRSGERAALELQTILEKMESLSGADSVPDREFLEESNRIAGWIEKLDKERSRKLWND